MSNCITCTKSSEGEVQSFEIGANKEIQNALCKHFWFGEDQYLKSIICYPCWNKLEDFHRFYCEVEELHSQQLFPQIQLLEIKQEHAQHDFAPEQLDEFVEPEGDVKCKEDPSEANDSATVNDAPVDDDEDYEQESDDSGELINSDNDEENDGGNESRQDGIKLEIPTRATEEEIQEYVSKNLTLECNTCSERYKTFRDIQKHSREKHGRPATVTCCGRKLMNGYRFDDHIQYHLNPDRFKCSQCSRKCPNREALSRHIRKVHTPGDRKVHGCHVCNKKFTSKHNLKKHLMTHGESTDQLPEEDDVHEKMIAENVMLECDSCQHMFLSYQALQTHSKAEHTNLRLTG